jgi:glucokinase
MPDYYLGIDLGGTDIKLGIVDESGRIIRSGKNPTHAELGPDGVLSNIARHARDLIDSGHPVKAIGMACPGPLNSREGIVYETPNLSGWKNVPAKSILQDKLQLPVALINDANAAAYGEWWVGAGREVDTMIMFTLGTGVGGGIVINDELYTGPDDTAAELGHMIINFEGPQCACGNYGCIEAYASATAIRREVKKAFAEGVQTKIQIPEGAEDDFGARVVYDAAMEGDPFAIELFRKVGHYLGIAAASMINAFNPEMICYGGALSNAEQFIFEPLRQTALANSFETPGKRAKIVKATLGNDAGIIGAAALAVKYVRGQ